MKSFLIWIGQGIATFARWYFQQMARLLRWTFEQISKLVRSRPVRFAGRAVLSTARIAAVTGIIAGLALGAGWLCIARVPPGMIGVRQKNFGEGIVPEDHVTGLHFSVRGLDQWHLIERGTQLLTFAWESEGGQFPMLNVRTKDGNTADVGIAVPYHVKLGEAHMLVRDGLKNTWKQRVRDATEKILLQELANLSSEDMANTDVRLERCAQTLPKLNAQLAALHVEAERVLITQVIFAIAYEQKLQERQRIGQSVLVSAVTTQVDQLRLQQKQLDGAINQLEEEIRAQMSKDIEDRYAEGRQKIFDLQMQAREYDRQRKAEAQAEYDRMIAEGERAVARAEQLKEELANEVYDSKGGRLMLARRAAENLNIRQVTLNSNDPRVPSILDLDELVNLIMGTRPTTPARGGE